MLKGFASFFGKRANATVASNEDVFVSQVKESTIIESIQTTIIQVADECYPDIEPLVQKIESHGMPVVTDGPQLQLQMILMLMNIQPGFVSPKVKKYEKLVSTLTSIFPEKANLDFSKGLIITTKETYHFTFLIYQLHHGLSYQHKLDGYQDEALALYNKFINDHDGNIKSTFFNTLSLDEARLLKGAIRRDREALAFVRHVLHEVVVPKNNSKLLPSGNAQA